MSENKYDNLEQRLIEEALPVWAKRLRVQDWTIVLKVVPYHKMSETWQTGQVSYNLLRKNATIYVLSPGDVPPNVFHPYDPERSLVHEVLHLYFAFFKHQEDSPELLHEEQAVDAIAGALIETGRVLVDLSPVSNKKTIES